MARVTHVKKAQQRYETVPVIDPATGVQKITPVLRKDGTQKVTKKGKPVVLRVTAADKTKPLPNHSCEKCGVEIKVGDPYKHVSPKSGPYGGRKRIRCAACPPWQHWELTTSKMAAIWEAQSTIEIYGGVDDVRAALVDFAETVRGVAEEYRESAQNIEDGFGHETYQSAELAEKGDALDGWADDLESWDPPDGDEYEPDEDLDEDEQKGAEEQWLQDLHDAANDAVNEDPS